MGFILDIFRKRALKKGRSSVPTSILPLSEIQSAVVLIDAEDSSYDACKRMVQEFFRQNNLRGEIFFMDFSKLNKEERLITSITTTILKKDVNFYGKPSAYFMNLFKEAGGDIFICLSTRTDFTIEYISACSNARFKVGRRQIGGNIFDLVLNEPEGVTRNQADVFNSLTELMKKIVNE